MTDSQSIYERNTGYFGQLTVARGSIYNGNDIKFYDNKADELGGAAYILLKSTFICSNCKFERNESTKGGAVYVESDSQTYITSSTFDRNKGSQLGSAFYISNSETIPRSFIKNSTFTNNEGNVGSIFLDQAALEIDDITLANNLSQKTTSGIFLILS